MGGCVERMLTEMGCEVAYAIYNVCENMGIHSKVLSVLNA